LKNKGNNLHKLVGLLKTFITILIIFIISLFLFFLAYQNRKDQSVSLFILTIASTLLSISLIAFTHDIITRHYTEMHIKQWFQNALDQQDLRILSKLSTFLLKEKDRLQEVVSADYQSHLLKTIVGMRCGDQSMADEIVDGLVNKILSFPKILRNRRHRIILKELADENYPQDIRDAYYKLTLEMKYQYNLDKEIFRLGYVYDREEFENHVQNYDIEYIFLLACPELENRLECDLFTVVKVEVNDLKLELYKKNSSNGSLMLEFSHKDLKDMINKDVSVQYIVSTFMPKRNHKFFDKIIFPTKNSSTLFEYPETDICSVSVRDFYVSAKQTKIRYFPPDLPRSVEVTIDDWVFPESGQIFVWNYRNSQYNY